MGKLSTEHLKRLLKYIKEDPRVIVPPLPGFDSGVHLIDDKYLVVSTDPCIGVPEKWFGWFLIHYVASDLALFGARLEFCTINLLGPTSTKPQIFYRIMNQASRVAEELETAIVTGHTGTYQGISTLIGICTGYGMVDKDKLITPSNAHPGDYILCTKPIGLEIAINFALIHKSLAERLFGIESTKKLAKQISMQTCVKEALLLAEIDGVHAMHDATEGGLTAALNEMAEASEVGFIIEWNRINIPEEVQILQDSFQFSDEEILSMSSTGTILAAVNPKAKGRVQKILDEKKIDATFVGYFTEDKGRILIKNQEEILFPKRADDPYEKILSEQL
jgi:hydrogenase maturation factor